MINAEAAEEIRAEDSEKDREKHEHRKRIFI